MDVLTVARVEKLTGRVINIEVATQSWVDAQNDPALLFITYTNDAPAMIGGTWNGTIFLPPKTPEAPSA